MSVVAIFGASGFVGRYVVRELARTGARIRAAVRRPGHAGFLRPMGDVGQIIPLAANIRDDASVARAVEGADTVINLVGILAPQWRQSFPAVHVEGARRVAAAARDAGAGRLIHVSAIGADEDSDAEYAATKGLGENLVREAFAGAIVVRPSLVIGPEDDFFNRFAALARFVPALPLPGWGNTRFQPVYVGDVGAAIAALARRPEDGDRILELGGPQVFTYRELMEILLTEIRRRRLLLPVPYPVLALQGAVLERLPFAPLTRDQVRLLRRDNVTSGEYPGLSDLGIDPTAIGMVLSRYLGRYRRGG